MWAFIGRAIEKVMFGAIKSGTETVKSVTDIQKNRLDIKLKQHELEEKENPIRIATFEEIKEFDPKVERIREMFHSSPAMILSPPIPTVPRSPWRKRILLLVIFVIFGLVIWLMIRYLT